MAGCGVFGDKTHPEPVTVPIAAPVPPSHDGHEVALFALGLLDTGYRFGGKNPDAGLDCSGMVSYVYREAVSRELKGNAATQAKQGRLVAVAALRPGDLVFFNTTRQSYSHVGIFIGDGRFVHAPSGSGNGKVRVDRLDNRYYQQRFADARTYFD